MDHTLLDEAHKQFWGQLAHKLKPEFWFTFNFVRPYNDQTAMEAFQFVTKAIQKKIPSHRKIRGVAAIERTWKNAHFEGCLHMHCLLGCIDKNFRNPDAYIHSLAYKSVLRLRDWQGREMTEESTIDVQRVHDPDPVIKYALKDLNRYDTNRKPRIALILPTGLDVELSNFKI